jgi:hypothetical protein
MKLLLVLFFCHFLADYTPLSDAKMLAAKRFGRPFTPILAHGFTHGALMGVAMIYLGVDQILAIMLALGQTWSHAGIDVLKGRLNARYATLQSPANVVHWVVFGLDQYAHTAIIILMWHLASPH